jgi:hypothetical protein
MVVRQDVNNNYTRWTREESLVEIKAVRFVDLGEPEVEETRHLLMEEEFLARLSRHIIELKVGYVGVSCLLADEIGAAGVLDQIHSKIDHHILQHDDSQCATELDSPSP